MKIWDLPNTDEEALRFFQEAGIILREKFCRNGHLMTLYDINSPTPRWMCKKRACRETKRIRTGTWLEGSTLRLVTVLRFIYSWANELTSIKWCESQLNMSRNCTVVWNNYMREICCLSLLRLPNNKIGGDNLIVEVDESSFTQRKNNLGLVLPAQCVLGGICKETGQCFLVNVADRNARTLINAICEHVAPGSIIVSDCWKENSTRELEEAGYRHTYNFVGSAKWRNKRLRGTSDNT